MPTNCTGKKVQALATEYPDRLAHLMGVGGWRKPFLPYALDNGAFVAWKNEERWMQREFVGLLDQAQKHVNAGGQSPKWVVVPDVVGNRDGTLWAWDSWVPRLQRWYGWPLAMAVQDGMTPGDVPKEADVVFVGGTTTWKRRTFQMWCNAFPRVHIGRINTYKWLWACAEAGAESCDGTGWFRGDKRQLAGLHQFLAESSKGPQPQLSFYEGRI